MIKIAHAYHSLTHSLTYYSHTSNKTLIHVLWLCVLYIWLDFIMLIFHGVFFFSFSLQQWNFDTVCYALLNFMQFDPPACTPRLLYRAHQYIASSLIELDFCAKSQWTLNPSMDKRHWEFNLAYFNSLQFLFTFAHKQTYKHACMHRYIGTAIAIVKYSIKYRVLSFTIVSLFHFACFFSLHIFFIQFVAFWLLCMRFHVMSKLVI